MESNRFGNNSEGTEKFERKNERPKLMRGGDVTLKLFFVSHLMIFRKTAAGRNEAVSIAGWNVVSEVRDFLL